MQVNDMEKEVLTDLRFPCPGCAGTASVTYTKPQIEEALEAGELEVAHVFCGHRWKVKLDLQLRQDLQEYLKHLEAIAS